MKKTQSIVSKRRKKILDYIGSNESINTNDLADNLNISPVTLRRDLQVLDDEGLIVRYYGGAKLASTTNNDTKVNLEKNKIDSIYNEKKHILAKYAADLIDDGDTIFINSSSTALLILDYLANKRVYVVTNNGKSLQSTIGPNTELILTGGQVYERKQSLVGEFATYILSKITADKCFLGVSGITSDSGISTSVLQETLINHEMINRCNGPVYVLADSSKVGVHHNFSSGDIKEITHLITDCDINQSDVESLQQKGVTIIPLEYKLNS